MTMSRDRARSSGARGGALILALAGLALVGCGADDSRDTRSLEAALPILERYEVEEFWSHEADGTAACDAIEYRRGSYAAGDGCGRSRRSAAPFDDTARTDFTAIRDAVRDSGRALGYARVSYGEDGRVDRGEFEFESCQRTYVYEPGYEIASGSDTVVANPLDEDWYVLEIEAYSLFGC